MDLRFLGIIASCFVLRASGMCPPDILSAFERLDRYKECTVLDCDVKNLYESYSQALDWVKGEIVSLSKELIKEEEATSGIGAEIDEDGYNSECTRSMIELYNDRLYDLSSDGELGKKLLQNKIVEDIKEFTTLDAEIKNNVRN